MRNNIKNINNQLCKEDQININFTDQHFIQKWNNIKTILKIETIDEPININCIMDTYINEVAPFKAGKKKAEFPDAFSLEMIKIWQLKSDINNKVVYFISDDNDWQRYADDNDYTIFKSIHSFIDKVNKDSYFVIYPKIETLILNNDEYFYESIEDALYKDYDHFFSNITITNFSLIAVNESSHQVEFNNTVDLDIYTPGDENGMFREYIDSIVLEFYICIETTEDYSDITELIEVSLKNDCEINSSIQRYYFNEDEYNALLNFK